MYRDDLLRAAKAAQRLSIKDITESSGLSFSTVDNILQGRSKNPGINNLRKVVEAIGLSMAEIVSEPEVNVG